jgi:hypothetical protein
MIVLKKEAQDSSFNLSRDRQLFQYTIERHDDLYVKNE